MSAIADKFTGAKKAQRAANAAAQQIQFNPYSIVGSSLGSVTSNNGTINLGMGALERLYGSQFGQLGSGLLTQAGQAGPFGAAGFNLAALDQALGGIQGLTPTAGGLQAATPNITQGGVAPTASISQLLSPLLGGADVAALQQSASGNLGASRVAREALGSFDPNDFAATQLSRLNALARPGEETAAAGLLDRIYGSGRLGVRLGGRQQDLSELAYAQEQSATQRQLAALGLAGQEQDRLAQQASLFGNLGQNAATTAANVGQSIFGQQVGAQQLRGAQQQQLFDQLLSGSNLQLAQQQGLFGQQQAGAEFGLNQASQLFGQLQAGNQQQQNLAFGRFGAAQEALGYGQQNQAQQIQQALALFSGLQGLQQSPLALLSSSLGAGGLGLEAATSRAGLISNAAQQRAAANSQFFSGLAGAAGNFFSGGGLSALRGATEG